MTRVEQYEDRDPAIKTIGIITLEDIIEELVQKEAKKTQKENKVDIDDDLNYSNL